MSYVMVVGEFVSSCCKVTVPLTVELPNGAMDATIGFCQSRLSDF